MWPLNPALTLRPHYQQSKIFSSFCLVCYARSVTEHWGFAWNAFAVSCLLCSCSWCSVCLECLLPSLPVSRWTFVFELCLAFSYSIKILYLWCSLWFIHYTNHECLLGARQWMWSQLIVRWEDRSFKTNFKKCPFSHLFFHSSIVVSVCEFMAVKTTCDLSFLPQIEAQ